ncbi:MFS-type transporter involved in bile tolerance, Atg22 family [Enhydrobacter aerosaccus]|uniref:MFS-type transporter involved in bile tolerance, Atg22 family n=1 Tax=Enhydrobacter aerosaccus TaxID=225324 RepID=A0A1T4S2A8_9HYPH|nr:MFS transporter [Enhydrobacter aerosaccus]SKA22068.1 MFS-type transporter involved in bile tolerance, Atg22 family [Enhydrobacter aerosaccus]
MVPRYVFPAYLAGLGSWFVPMGIQMVLFPWLVAVVLRLDAFAVGVAQAAIMAPSLLFLPLGGLMADRGNPRRLLLRYHLAYAIPPVVLAVVLSQGGLSYALLIAYALAAGSISAFAVPTRDTLLPAVSAEVGLPRAVALATALQFAGQLVGIACASSADRLGPAPLLLLHAVLVLAGAAFVWWLPDPAAHTVKEKQGFWRSVGEGLSVAAKTEQIWPVLLLNLGVGIFYVGPFMAVLPLAVRDHYGGGAFDLSLVSFAFWAATIVASIAFAALARRLTLRGRLIGCAVMTGALVLLLLSMLPPFPIFAALNFVWGIGAGITMTQSRTVVQIVAPPTHRARLMSLFQLGLGGGGPIGAFLTGAICAVWGIRAAMMIPAAAMILLIAVVLVQSRLWVMRTVE